MKKILILAMLLVSTSANAFYTSFEYDINRLREGVFKQEKGTIEQKEKFMEQMTPVIKQAREEAYTRVAMGCSADVARLCPQFAQDIDSSVKCLSENITSVSGACGYVIQQNFRKK